MVFYDGGFVGAEVVANALQEYEIESYSLEKVIIGEGVLSIGAYAFDYCYGLTSIKYFG